MWKLYPLSSFLKLGFYRRVTLNSEKTKSSRSGRLCNLSASVCFFFSISQDDLQGGDHPCCPRCCFTGVAWGPVDIDAPPCPSHHPATASESPSLPTLACLFISRVQVAPVPPPDSSSVLSGQDGSASLSTSASTFQSFFKVPNTCGWNRGPLSVRRLCNLLSVRIRRLRLSCSQGFFFSFY